MAGTVELAARFVALGSEPDNHDVVRWLLWHCRRERLLMLWFSDDLLQLDEHRARLKYFQCEVAWERRKSLEPRRKVQARSF